MNNLTSSTGPGDSDLFDIVADAIETRGYIVLPEALPPSLNVALYLHLKSLDADAIAPARIGREQDEMRNPFVRNDRICGLVSGQQQSAGTHRPSGLKLR